MLTSVSRSTEPRLPVRLPSAAFSTLCTVISAQAPVPIRKNTRSRTDMNHHLQSSSPSPTPVADGGVLGRRSSRVDTPPGLQPHGFSVHPRRYPRESPQGLPGPLNVPGRVFVSIEDEAAGRADVGA